MRASWVLRIVLGCPCKQFTFHLLLCAYAAIKALTLGHADLNFSQIQPAPVLGSEVPLDALFEAQRLARLERLYPSTLLEPTTSGRENGMREGESGQAAGLRPGLAG